jgi:hypothetical protein
MANHLRIHRDEQPGSASEPAVPEVLPFPMKAVRERLVAGTVSGDPKADAPEFGKERMGVQVRWSEEHSSVIRFPGVSGIGREDRPPSSQELVSQIEQTLERMQQRLTEFRDQLDDTFKFPAVRRAGSGDDGLPPAA